jgi:hypothetical protein
MKMDAASSSESLIRVHQTTRRHIPDDAVRTPYYISATFFTERRVLEARFEIFTAMKVHRPIMIVLVMTPYSLVNGYHQVIVEKKMLL